MSLPLTSALFAKADAPERDLLGNVVARVGLRLQRRLAWVNHLRRELQTRAVTAAALELLVTEADNPVSEAEFCRNQPELAALELAIAEIERALAGAAAERRTQLTRLLGLTEQELDVVDVLVAATLEPSVGFAFASLHGSDDFAYPTETAIAKVMRTPLPLITESGGLLGWKLVTFGELRPGEPRSLHLDPFVIGWLAGKFDIARALLDRLHPLPKEAPLPEWPLDAIAERCAELLQRGQALRVLVLGRERSGRKCFARALATRLGFSAFGIDVTGLSDADYPTCFLSAQRHATLTNALPVWCGAPIERPFPVAPAVAPLQLVIGDSDLNPPAELGIADVRVTLPLLELERRQWAFARQLPALAATQPELVEELAERFPLELGDIAELGRLGVTTAEDVREACRALRRGRLGELGQTLECPFTRDDLTLAPRLDQTLDEILFEARARVHFWARPEARRLFPRGRGLVVLMSGPPGTGKTMAAQVVARELGLDLVRVDLATTVSKYIGETAKNLKKIFERAADMNAVILFDEADALFTKRTEVKDAHDRYANADTNYLLQLLEAYPGIALLASNRRQNIDVGFVRRIRYTMDFPKPAPAERLRIWQRLTQELLGDADAARLGPVLEALAQKVELSGAQIKLAVLNALFSAQRLQQPIGIEHLIAGAERELNKESRGVSHAEQTQLFKLAGEARS
jgi:hypothetical protein